MMFSYKNINITADFCTAELCAADLCATDLCLSFFFPMQ